MEPNTLSLSGTPSLAGSTSRRRAPHRAVAAVQQSAAAAVDPLRGASPLLSAERPYRSPQHSKVIRYESREALRQARTRLDPFIERREELARRQEQPTRPNELDGVPDALLLRVFAFLGHTSRDAVELSAVCRRLRALALAKCGENQVNVVPGMLTMDEFSICGPLEGDRLKRHASIVHFYNRHKRGQHVRSVSLLQSTFAATLPVTAAFPTAAILPTISLLAELPNLTSLDVRSVTWSPASASKIPYFLSDLYLVAPQLRTLKIGVELYGSWTPGWWQRHVELNSLVIASRREQPAPQVDVPHPTVPLHPDLLVMLQSDRLWRLKFWSAMDESSLRRILCPTTAFLSLTELTLNAFGCSSLSVPPDSSDMSDSKKGKAPKRPMNSEDGESLAFPRLTALTLVNLDENPMIAVELYGKFLAQAPRLSYFSVCNTVKYSPPERLKGRRRVAAAK